jgi:hypothetical protein
MDRHRPWTPHTPGQPRYTRFGSRFKMTNQARLFLLVDEGDVTIHRSLRDLEGWIEAIDVPHSKAFEDSGRIVRLEVPDGKVRATITEDLDVDELDRILQRFVSSGTESDRARSHDELVDELRHMLGRRSMA